MQAWVMEDVPVSNDSGVLYRSRDTAVSSLLSLALTQAFLLFLNFFFLHLCLCFINLGRMYMQNGGVLTMFAPETQLQSTVLL